MRKLVLASILLLVQKAHSAIELTCPQSLGADAGSTPLVIAASGEFNLILCGHREPESTKDDFIVSEFDVFSIDKGGKASEPLVEVTASDSYRVRRNGSKLELQQLEKIDKKNFAVLETVVACEKKCSVSPPKCIFNPPKLADPKSLSKFESHIKGAKAGKVPKEKLVLRLYGLALTGNKRAQEIFFKPPGTLRIDGESGELFERSRAILQKLKDAKCKI